MSEYLLNTSEFMMSYDDYMSEANAFLNHFSTSGGSFTDYQTEAVSFSSLEELRNSLPETGHTSGSYIRGLRVCYGLKSGAIKLYYVPIYGDLANEFDQLAEFDLSETSGDLAAIINSDSLPVYMNVSGELVDIMSSNSLKTEALANVAAYKHDIRIILETGDDPSSYDNGRDGKSIFFPFQEVDALQEEYNASTIFFTSTSRVADDYYKHFIVISHLDPNTTGSFSGDAANLGKLCPPNCPSVIYSPL